MAGRLSVVQGGEDPGRAGFHSRAALERPGTAGISAPEQGAAISAGDEAADGTGGGRAECVDRLLWVARALQVALLFRIDAGGAGADGSVGRARLSAGTGETVAPVKPRNLGGGPSDACGTSAASERGSRGNALVRRSALSVPG